MVNEPYTKPKEEIMSDRVRTRIVKQAVMCYEKGVPVSNTTKVLSALHPNRPEENTKTLIEKSTDMYKSLMQATDQAGGSGWSIEDMSDMTVLELIAHLGVNNVRFFYTKPKDLLNKSHEKYKGKGACGTVTHHKCCKKLNSLLKHAEEAIKGFEEHLENSPGNIVAAAAVDIWKEVKEQIES